MKKNKCEILRECGGCSYPHNDYKGYLIKKNKYINDILSDITSKNNLKYPDSNLNIEDIIYNKEPLRYRYKAQRTFSNSKRKNIVSGFYKKNTHNIINVDDCIVEDDELSKIINSITNILLKLKYKPYDEDKKTGIFRHILVRKSYNTSEIMVILVTGIKNIPGKNNLIKQIIKENNNIKTIVQNINNKKTNLILSKEFNTLYGSGFILDKMNNYVFKISAGSFFQINPFMANKIYNKAIELLDIKKNETIIDCYCGIGIIGILASNYAKTVIGIEGSESFNDALYNKKKNKLNNIYFYKEDATKFMKKIIENNESADILIMDPSREGSTKEFLENISKLKVKKIAYISCNPVALKRDLDILLNNYHIKHIIPFDMFSFTNEIETLAILKRNNS